MRSAILCTGRFAGVGQNTASGQENWLEAIYAWQGENIDFEYGVEPKSGVVVGHYTQVRSGVGGWMDGWMDGSWDEERIRGLWLGEETHFQ